MLAQHPAKIGFGLGLRGGSSSPLQQAAAADHHPVERTGNRVGAEQGLLQQLRQVPEPAPERARQVGTGLAVEMATRQIVAAGRQPHHCAHQRACSQRSQHQTQCCPGRRCAHRQRQQQQRQRNRRHHRAAQVVKHFPAVDRTHRVAPGLQQKGQKLPVAAGPAVHPRGGHVGMKRRVFNQRDVGHCGAARNRAFQQVVAEHAVVRQPASQHRLQRLHVEQALAGVGAFAEQVLIDIGTGGAVDVDAALPGKQPVKQCDLARGGQRRDHARLQDAVAAGHPAPAGIKPGLILRMRRHAHQLAQAAGGQLGVAVQRHDVGCAGCDARRFAQIQKHAAAAFGQRGNQLLQLAALALPAYPALLALAEAALAVQHDETGRHTVLGRIQGVERRGLAHCLGQQPGIASSLGAAGVGPVGQQRKLGVAFGVGKVVQLQPPHQCFGGSGAGQHGGDHHHHPVVGRNAVRQGQPRQILRPG